MSMLPSSSTMNGTSFRSHSSLSEGSEESFVVLSDSVDAYIGEHTQIDRSSVVSPAPMPVFPSIPVTDAVSQCPNNMSMSVTSELSAEEIQSKLESLVQENLELKATLQQNNLAMKKQFSTLVMWQEDVMKVHQSHKEKFEETKKLIANLRAENAELKKATSLPFAKSTEDENEKINLKSKISALKFELETLSQGHIKFKNDHMKIIQELEIKLSESEKSKDEETTKLKIQIDNLSSQLQNMEKKYGETQKKLEEALAMVPSQEQVQMNENMKKQLVELTAELTLKHKVVKEKTDLIDSLQEQISKLKIDNETIPILRTQVDLYQSDFKQERQAREELKAQKDQIANDLQHLQRRNQKLLEEVERLTRDTFVHVSKSTSSARMPQSSSSGQSSRDNSPPLAQYMCPVCNKRFRSLGTLEDHVDSCLANVS